MESQLSNQKRSLNYSDHTDRQLADKIMHNIRGLVPVTISLNQTG
jgi:hypothetical protein